MRIKKLTSLLLAAIMCMSLTMLAGCKGGGEVGSDNGGAADSNVKSTKFTWWIGKSEGESEYGSYENNPGVKYLTDKVWTPVEHDENGNVVNTLEGQRVGFEFVAPAGAANPAESFSTSISSPPDIMELTYSQDSILELYNQGKALDITEYVEKYMPNYLRFLKDNDFYEDATNLLDGERRFLQLYNYYDSDLFSWMGVCYRRDWIVEYGKNPSTGEAFSGGYTDGTWSDNVLFPSWYMTDGAAGEFINQYKSDYPDWHGDYPITISDWEWMFGIFKEAIEQQSIADGYCMSLYQSGVNFSGTLVSSFGGGGVEWYRSADSGLVEFGTGGTAFRTYVEAMNTWYGNGWIDESFQTHTDLFYRTDEQTVRQGKVGLWIGMDSQLFDKMDISGGDASHLTNEICVMGAPLPINDIYGTDENKYKEPYCFYAVSQEISSAMVSASAVDSEEKKAALPALFTLMDYMYSEEGSVLKGGGFTKAQVEETQDPLYLQLGLVNGMCEYDAEKGWIFTAEGEKLTHNQTNVLKPMRLMGLEATIRNRVTPPEDKYRDGLFKRFKNSGFLKTSFISQLEPGDSKEYNRILNLVREKMTQEIPKFIKGEKSLDEWDSFVLSLERIGVPVITEMLNGI